MHQQVITEAEIPIFKAAVRTTIGSVLISPAYVVHSTPPGWCHLLPDFRVNSPNRRTSCDRANCTKPCALEELPAPIAK